MSWSTSGSYRMCYLLFAEHYYVIRGCYMRMESWHNLFIIVVHSLDDTEQSVPRPHAPCGIHGWDVISRRELGSRLGTDPLISRRRMIFPPSDEELSATDKPNNSEDPVSSPALTEEPAEDNWITVEKPRSTVETDQKSTDGGSRELESDSDVVYIRNDIDGSEKNLQSE